MSQDYEVHPDAAFSLETFETLKQLKEGTASVASVINYIQNPLKRLGYEIADRLPLRIKQEFKNGSWDNGYIGDEEETIGIYFDFEKQKGETSYESLVFSIKLDKKGKGLECGLYCNFIFSKYQKVFSDNLLTHQVYLQAILQRCLSSSSSIFSSEGSKLSSLSFSSVSRNTEKYQQFIDFLKQGVLDLYIISKPVIFRKSRLINTELDKICEMISSIFVKLFPIIILSKYSNPMPEIYRYIQEYWKLSPNWKTEFNYNAYIMDKITESTYLPESDIQKYINTLDRKKHIIFQGSSGTGKTYLAKQIAHYLTLCNDGFYEIIQFHPAYTYEDFIQGIRPITREDGQLEYKMIKGRFLEFCEKAEKCKTDCILIIDEINRANLSQVFGELMYCNCSPQ